MTMKYEIQDMIYNGVDNELICQIFGVSINYVDDIHEEMLYHSVAPYFYEKTDE